MRSTPNLSLGQAGLLGVETRRSAWTEIAAYVSHIREFRAKDWLLYCLWIGSIFGLWCFTMAFTIYGAMTGTVWPAYVWWVPVGVTLFCFSLAIDDIGHRTLYKRELAKGERYVHQMIAWTAIPSVICLFLCHQHPDVFRVPAYALIWLSLFYSGIDELLHWVRYLRDDLDRVEMWSHFVAITGHVLMLAAWWQWFDDGYPGVTETIARLYAQL